MTTELELARQHPSASGAERLVNCPGSWALEQQQPPEPENEFTASGNRMHRAWQTGDDSELVGDEPERMKRTREIEEELIADWHVGLTDTVRQCPQVISREKRLFLPIANMRFSGQPDLLITQGGYALILDLKSGWASVEPPVTNWQLRALAVLAWTSLSVAHVRVALVQPLRKQQAVCEYTDETLQASWKVLYDALNTAGYDGSIGAERIAGPWCAHCRARTICPEAMNVVQSLALPGRWDILPPERKLDLWRKSKVAAKICADIQKAVKADLAADPESIPGLRKKPDTEVREISDVLAFYQHLIDDGVPKDKLDPLFLSACGINVGDATKIIAGLKAVSEKDASKTITKSTPGVTMKPRSGEVEEA